jgi:4a-hydroxytetrahydrobiopterin dehydratase
MSDLKKKQWLGGVRSSMSAPQIVARLTEIPGWTLDGDGSDVAIQKTFRFTNYLETMSFVNAVAFIAERHNHHPDMNVHFNRCVVRFNTHDVNGISITDIECAAEIEALLKAR